MKPIFISIPNKLLFSILTVVLLVAAGYSWLSLTRLQSEFQQHQITALKKVEQQFELYENHLVKQVTVWFETLADINQLQGEANFTFYANALGKQYESLQLHYNVNDIWLYDDKKMLFSTNSTPNFVKTISQETLALQEPNKTIVCQETCQQVIALPLLNYQGEVAIVILTVSLVDMLYTVKNVLNSDVVVVKIPNGSNSPLSSDNILSTSSKAISDRLLLVQDELFVKNINILAKEGILFDEKEQFLLANFLTLSTYNDFSYLLVVIENITKLKNENLAYQKQFLLSVLLIFCAVSVLTYLIIKPFTSRLLRLSKALPKLAKHEFYQFREFDISKNSVFIDELDYLAKASNTLSLDLEQLNLEVEQKTKELENIAMYDLLTGLPNRNMLSYILTKQIEKLAFGRNKIAVMFLDLDDFKKVNDSHGHGEGDKLLVEAALRLRASIKTIDLACRFGGDEFVIVLNQITTLEETIIIANDILEQFRRPIKISDSNFYVSTSIGIVMSDDKDIKVDNIISQADIAMYEAKAQGGGTYHIYHNDMYQRVAHRVLMEGEVRKALLNQQFSLSLQPQIFAKTHKLHGFEALLRWKHPERGMISPDDFIPILENSQHMIELGYWVINRCFEIVSVLKKLGHSDCKIAINLSAGQFADPELSNFLVRLLDQHQLSPQYFELELTEQTLVKDIDKTIAVMNELKLLGFSFAIDDFGTGYSSLAYLKKMPVDVIKIDKSFVFGMLEKKVDHQIIMSTIAMVKNLELIVVAEGVETEAQLRILAENDCDIIQGYYFAKPVPDVEIYDFIANNFDNYIWKEKPVP
jgi:diguanylate cyclase (GGDEF)-like protein